jgi:hypothetical protein
MNLGVLGIIVLLGILAAVVVPCIIVGVVIVATRSQRHAIPPVVHPPKKPMD